MLTYTGTCSIGCVLTYADYLQYRLFGSKGTADYYLENGIDITPMEMPTDTESGSQINLKAFH